MMEARIWCFVLTLQILCLVSGSSRPFAPNDGVCANQSPGHRSEAVVQVLQDSKQGTKSIGVTVADKGLVNKEEEYSKGLSKIGSSPPSCEKKCYGCTPCEAIQVPTTSKKNHNHFGVNYANYEPEGWKCKCGPSLYSP